MVSASANPVLVSALIAALHFVLQAWPRILNPFFGVDCWRHMLAADHIRRHRRLPVVSMDNYLFTGAFDYPPVLAVILAAFPKNVTLVLQAVLAPLVETVHGILVFILVGQWTHNGMAAIMAQAMFALVPITALENSQLNARGLGSLLITLNLVGGSMYHDSGSLGWLAAALAAGTLALLTHKMASQTLALMSVMAIPVACKLGSVALVTPLSLLLGFALFPKLSRRVLAGQMAVLRYYRRVFASAPTPDRSVESRGFVGRLVAIAKSNPIFTLVGADPWIIPVAAILLARPSWMLPPGIGALVVFWLAAVYVLIVSTTWLRPIRFLGDGPRYSYYLGFPVAVIGGPLLASILQSPGKSQAWMLILAAAVGAGIIAQVVWIQWRAVVGDRERSYRGDVRKIGELLKTCPDARVAVFPLCTAEVLAFFSGCRVLSTDSAAAHAEHADFRMFNPRMTRPLSHFLERFSVTHCVTERSLGAEALGIPPSFPLVFQGEDFRLWSREWPQGDGAFRARPASLMPGSSEDVCRR